MSPFVSRKQRSYLKRKKPKVYRRFKRKYGTKIRNKKIKRK